jgi:hypothetical protein
MMHNIYPILQQIPCFQGVPLSALKIPPLSGGTNRNYQIDFDPKSLAIMI